MVQKIVTVYTDDLTGAESSEVQTHTFSLDGVNYEIDLVSESYDMLFEALAPFISNGRKVGRTKKAGRPGRPSNHTPSAEEVRQWARDNNYEINNRGRVPTDIREAYERAR
ncbi:histone-like nucleoid-structuring protein Lsr2 [Streptomyces chartreusis]|uniref:histone-like nucleoid-structuring protein Lsr2 n=1 Tax=Streptomyces chartreusis TaxID=1969 RepID=UPI0038209410